MCQCHLCRRCAAHPAATKNGHHSRRLRSAGNNRLCLLAKSCRDPGGSRAYLAVQEAPQNSIPMEQMQLTWLPDGCTVTWDDSTYQEYGAYSCLIDNGKPSKEHQVLGIAQMPLENKVNIQAAGRMMPLPRKIKRT